MRSFLAYLLFVLTLSSMILVLCSCGRKTEISMSQDYSEYQNFVDEVALHHKMYEKEHDQFIEDNSNFLSYYQSEIENAYNKAENAINVLFDGYKESIPDFAEEITSFTKTSSLLWKSLQDKFMKDKTHVETQINEMFERTVFDSVTFTAEVKEIIGDFQSSIAEARYTYWENVASYLHNKTTTFSPIDLGEIQAVSIAGVLDLHNDLGKDIGETGVTTITIGGVCLAVLTATTAIPGFVDDVIAIAGTVGYSMIQGKEREKYIIENYTMQLDSLKSDVLALIVSIFNEAIDKTSEDSDSIIKAIKEGNV